MVVSHQDYIGVVFRGTDELEDWLDNLNVVYIKKLFGKFHRGFYFATMDVLQEMHIFIEKYQATNIRPVWFAGHSLGGAMATIAAADYIYNKKKFAAVYTFGQPRCMLKKTAKKFTQATNNCYFRFQNNNDISTRVPSAFFGYFHGGNAIYISEQKKFNKFKLRRERDSNPRYIAVYTLSKRVPSASRPPLLF